MKKFAASRSIRRIVLVVAACAALTGCPTINHFEEAQSAFNRAAELDNQLRLKVGDPAAQANTAPGALEAQVRSGYASALVSLDEAESDQDGTLKKYRLYGNMLVLRALTYWRLGELGKADQYATQASNLPDSDILPRDKALAMAMPGLIKNDQAYAIIDQFKPTSGAPLSGDADAKKASFGAVKELIDQALKSYDESMKVPDKNNDETKVYLSEAKLAAYQNLSTARSRFSQIDPSAESGPKRAALADFHAALCKANGKKKDDALPAAPFHRLLSWDLLLGVKLAENKCPG